jgi:LacI family gluconate utilization system Gnt-I transcriptional repressor
VKSPRYEIGRTAADRILARLEGGDPPRRSDLGFEFVAGETA